ncbi:MAG: DUF4013 domain-containing protein [Euryarchaeota archaeon]|nr:DUF4013 domain-containing protein [Euryarchaeota archaeon]
MIIIETISFSEAFKYPFKTPARLLYILLLIVPIIGWLAFFGYIVRLINEFIEGRYEGLIKLDFMEDLKLGLMMFLKALPFYIIYTIILYAATDVSKTFGNLVSLLLGVFVIPMLTVNFFRKQTVESFFEFNILNVVKDNPEEYIIAVLKQYALGIIYLTLSIVLVGIPGLFFTNSIFIANIYGRLVEKRI